MTNDEFLARIDGLTPGGRPNQWRGRCPAHDDTDPSLSISITDEGKLLANCFAGCEFPAILAAAAEQRPQDRGAAPPGEPPRQPVLTLAEYAAAKGLGPRFLILQGVRQDSRGLAFIYYDREGRRTTREHLRLSLAGPDVWRWLGPPADRIIPYGRQRLGMARQARELWVVEGESDALSAWVHEVPCLALPGSSRADTLAAEDLIDIERLYLVKEPDGGGEMFVAGLARRLTRLRFGGQAFVVTLPVKDLNDLHRTAGDAFAAQLTTAKDQARPLPIDTGPWAQAVPAPEYVEALDVEAPFLEPRFLVRGAVTEWFSPRGLGKTLVAHEIAVRQARSGLRVLLIDRDNPPREVKRRLTAWGARGAPTLKVLTRDTAPALTDTKAWATFPVADYDLIIIDSLDASTEGVGEEDSAKPAKALAALLDVVRRVNGPACLVLGNTTKAGSHGRGSGVMEDRADIVYEVRDATGLVPSGGRDWWSELPPPGREAWAQRATRRTRRQVYRLAFVPTKFRVGVEPDPFCLEVSLQTTWAVTDVTADLVASGTRAQEQARQAREATTQSATEAFLTLIRDRQDTDKPVTVREAEAFLKDQGLTLAAARALIKKEDGRLWTRVPGTGKGGPWCFVSV